MGRKVMYFIFHISPTQRYEISHLQPSLSYMSYVCSVSFSVCFCLQNRKPNPHLFFVSSLSLTHTFTADKYTHTHTLADTLTVCVIIDRQGCNNS